MLLPLILISLSHHENRHATHLFDSDGFGNSEAEFGLCT